MSNLDNLTIKEARFINLTDQLEHLAWCELSRLIQKCWDYRFKRECFSNDIDGLNAHKDISELILTANKALLAAIEADKERAKEKSQ